MSSHSSASPHEGALHTSKNHSGGGFPCLRASTPAMSRFSMAISCAAVGSATGGSHGAVEARVSELRRARGGGRAATSDCVRARIAKRTDHHPNFGRKSTLELAAFDDAAACRKDPSKREGGELKSRQNSTARRQPKTRRNCRNSKPQPRCCSPAPPRSTALRAAQPLHKSALIVRPEWLCCAPWPRASR